MKLLQLLLEASKKDIIINKIGLHKNVADELVSNYGKKRALLYANIFKD